MAARKLNYLIFFTIAFSCFSIIILGISLGTKNWYKAEARIPLEPVNGTTIVVTNILTTNYGLFSGSKTITQEFSNGVTVTFSSHDLQVVSVMGENVAMYSCGIDGENRKRDIEAWLNPVTVDDLDSAKHNRLYCKNVTGSGRSNKMEIDADLKIPEKDRFLNFGLWITTLLFLMCGMLFSAVSGALALYNTFRAPSNPIFNVFGLYIWNGISASSILLAVILWGAAFGSTLKDQAAVGETISGYYEMESGSLGYSYWITILAEILCWANIGILRYRNWEIHRRETKLRVVDNKLTSPDHLLF